METRKVRTWNGFLNAIKKVRNQYGTYARSIEGSGKVYERNNLILFRGQTDAEWKLESTLERASEQEFSELRYLRGALNQIHEIESFTGQRWDVPSQAELESIIGEHKDHFYPALPAYEYLVYLRHHGYPSPLLDWTESPFIAAFFALIEQSTDDACVYCYIERLTGVKGGIGGRPKITLGGPFVRTHKRHFSQKAWYTVSSRWDGEKKQHYFCSHESAFEEIEGRTSVVEQDVLIKIVLPAKLRKEALKHLNDFNINYFTLFQSEDSLIKYLATKNFIL